MADRTPDKRQRKIDDLLNRPAYVTWWTTRLCDLTGSNAGYLGATDMAQPVAKQWRDWIERRVRDNVGWDQIVAGIVLARSRRPGQTYRDFTAEQSTFVRKTQPEDFTALDQPMPHYWFRDNMKLPKDKALAFGYTFLGIRLQCAECHKHPYDQWSQQDFEQFTEFFTRIQAGISPAAATENAHFQEMLGVPVKLNTAALRRQMYLRVAAEGRPIPWKEVYIAAPLDSAKPQMAKLLAGDEIDISQHADPRAPLMRWLVDQRTSHLARAFVNRIWANYFSVGIIEPPDDLNLANPPSNKALLDYLTREFVSHDYDIKWLHREITNSRTYQLSWRTNDSNRRDETNFSHAIIRRLPAEVIVDGIWQSTANDRKLNSANSDVAGRKIGQHPRSYQTRAIDFSLLIFGKPLRTTACDCERQEDPTLLQALYVRNDQELLELLQRQDGWLFQLSKELRQELSSVVRNNTPVVTIQQAGPPQLEPGAIDELIRAAYLRALSRQPNAAELGDCRQHILQAPNTVEGLRDLMWALLNCQEFITNH